MRAANHFWIARDIIGGNPALDLVNTVSGWNDTPEDWVPNIDTFLRWARISSVLSAEETDQAEFLAKDSPVVVERVLAAAKELRFALWRLIDSLERHKDPDGRDLSVISEWARRLSLSQEIRVSRHKISLAIDRDISPLELPALRITSAALRLLTDPPPGRIKTCPGGNCGWKFLDHSKNQSRRWCDMSLCGNLAKGAHFRSRNRRAAGRIRPATPRASKMLR